MEYPVVVLSEPRSMLDRNRVFYSMSFIRFFATFVSVLSPRIIWFSMNAIPVKISHNHCDYYNVMNDNVMVHSKTKYNFIINTYKCYTNRQLPIGNNRNLLVKTWRNARMIYYYRRKSFSMKSMPTFQILICDGIVRAIPMYNLIAI